MNQLVWRIPIFGIATAVLILFVLFVASGDPTFYVLFLIVPAVVLSAGIFLLLLFFQKTRHRSAELLLTALVFLGTSMAGLNFEKTLRPKLRWTFSSHRLKMQALAQSSQSPDELKHIEWDGWGGAPVGDWTAYVVFDPADLLNSDINNHQFGKVRGIPCDVLDIQKLEPHWYSVTLEVDEWWDRCRKQ